MVFGPYPNNLTDLWPNFPPKTSSNGKEDHQNCHTFQIQDFLQGQGLQGQEEVLEINEYNRAGWKAYNENL